MKFGWKVLLPSAIVIPLAACHSSMENKDAVQRGIMDRLSQAGLSTQNMDVDISHVVFHGNQAEADVEVRPKGATHEQGMELHYGLENQSGKWVVVSHTGMAGHGGGGVMPGSPNPHGDSMPAMPPDHGSKMPSPNDLPPVGKRQ